MPVKDIQESIKFSSYLSKQYYEKAIKAAADAENDTNKEQREKEHECRWCFYIRRPRIAGQAFTDSDCIFCEKPMRFATTSVDKVCIDCSDRYHVCVYCGGELF